MKNLVRLVVIIYIISRYYILYKFFDIRKLDKMLHRLGPIFVKFGQTLSTRPDIIGEKLALELINLRDNLPPFKSKIAIDIVEKEFGLKLNQIFKSFEHNPVNAASIAQIHRAITHDDKPVAVKILRPRIEFVFERDIRLLKYLALKFNKFFKKHRRLKLYEVILTFEKSIKIELDLRFEAAAASELKDNLKDDPNIYIPIIYWNTTTKRVMTIEWIDGIKISDKQAIIEEGLNPTDIAASLAISFFNQAYCNGFFHADLHPGNILIKRNGQVALIDFGIMGRLDKKTRIYVASILDGFLKRDYYRVASIHFDAGYVPNTESLELFAQACRSIGEPIIGLPVNQISIAKLLIQLFKITEDFSMETQPQLLLLQRTMIMVEGIGVMLDENVNMWKLAEPWIIKWAKKNIGFDSIIIDKIKDYMNNISKKDNVKEIYIKEIIYSWSYKQMLVTVAISVLSSLIITKIF